MKTNDYWLVSIDEEEVNVSLVLFNESAVDRIVVGKPKNYQEDDPDSLIFAVDASLSDTALQAGIEESAEPETAAFILSPFWIDIDGQISAAKFKLVEQVCKKLKLKPLGFIGNDDAFVENQLLDESNPSSYILINLKPHQFNLSLIYFGKIKERFHQQFEDGFSPKTIENILNNLSSQSALPPVITFFGDTSLMPLEDIKNYPWIGKKIGDIFFHLPEIKFFDTPDITKIWSDFINYQIIGGTATGTPKPSSEPEPEAEAEPEIVPEPEPESGPETKPEPEPQIIPMETLGFETVKESKPKKSFRLPHLPKIKLPHLKFNLLLWPLAFIPLLFLGLLLVNKAELTIYLNPYPVAATVPVTLDSKITNFDASSKIIPATVKSFEIKVTGKTNTTGKKVIGEKARGNIIIFNKQDKVQNIPKGAVLSTADGKQFELLTPVQVEGSTSDFTEGVMKFGQTKTVSAAAAIGPEYNLPKDTKLTFKDFSENLLVAKVESDFSGGTKNEVSVVGKADKTSLEKQLKDQIQGEVDNKIKNDVSNLSGVLLDTIQTTTKRIEFTRDIDEQADELEATLESTVTVFALSAADKNQIITALIDSPDKNKWDIKNIVYNLTMDVDKIDATQVTGELKIDGKVAPLLNIADIRLKLAGKSQTFAQNYLRNNLPNFYNWEFRSNLPFIGKIFPLPVIGRSITIISKIN